MSLLSLSGEAGGVRDILLMVVVIISLSYVDRRSEIC